MAKVIIGIHGLGNKPSKEILKAWWRSAMMEGLEKLGKTIDLPTFELVYWADILYDQPLDETIVDQEDPYFLAEKYLPSIQKFTPEDNSNRQNVLDFLEDQLDKLFLNEDLSINYTGIVDTIIHRYFRDLELYYAVECFDENDIKCKARKLIRERLVGILKKYEGDEILLVGHSMGSIISYDVLTFLLPEMNIHTFMTIGSPLGFPVIQGKIAAEWNSKRLVPPKMKTPPGVVHHWYNFADLKDKVALIYQLNKNFRANWRGVKPKDFVVNNDYQTEVEPNHHKSFGYLRATAFSELLYNFSKGESVYDILKERFLNLFHR